MLLDINTLLDFDFKDKTVFLRVDFNVPMNNGKVTSDIRIIRTLPTIRYLIENGANLIICSHLGRPKGVDKKYSLKPVKKYLENIVNMSIGFYEETQLEKNKIKQMVEKNKVVMLENIRFFEEETKNDANFANKLADLADIYINDAFGTMHRKHASSYGIAKHIPKGIGFTVLDEIRAAENILSNPFKPLTLVVGGAKVSDKLEFIENFLSSADKIIIGGGMAFAFIKALGGDIGNSIVENDKVNYCKKLIKKTFDKKIKLVLPVDVMVSNDLESNDVTNIDINKIPKEKSGFDIGFKSLNIFKKEISKSGTIVWNGPMGVFEKEKFSKGTMAVVDAVSNSSAYSFVGGGDSISALEKYDKKLKIDHVSTGGGASLQLLSGKNLPGLEIIKGENNNE